MMLILSEKQTNTKLAWSKLTFICGHNGYIEFCSILIDSSRKWCYYSSVSWVDLKHTSIFTYNAVENLSV